MIVKMEMMIKELGEIITGNTPSKNIEKFWESDDICFVKPDIISDNCVNIVSESNEYISEEARKKTKIVTKDTIFVTCIGSIGKIGIASEGEFAFNQQINAIIPNAKVNPRYLAYNLLFNRPRLVAIANAPVVPIINKSRFGEISVKIEMDTDKQLTIVNILDKLSNIIVKRKQELNVLDDLIKARFVELFGLHYKNHINEKQLDEVCNFIDYRGKTPEKSEYGIPLITAKNVKDNRFSIEPQEFIPEENYDDVMTRGIPKANDVLFTTEAPLGNVCRIPAVYQKFCVGQRLITMQPHEEVLNSEYLEHALASAEFQEKMWQKASGSTVKGIRSKLLVLLTIPVPQIELQKQFADFVKQVDKSKVLSETHIFYAEKSITPTTTKIFLKGRCIYGNEF